MFKQEGLLKRGTTNFITNVVVMAKTHAVCQLFGIWRPLLQEGDEGLIFSFYIQTV